MSPISSRTPVRPAPPASQRPIGAPPGDSHVVAGPIELMPRSVVVERRLTNRALVAWQQADDARIAVALRPFFDHSLVVRDPAGHAIVDAVGGPVSARFGLIAGLPLLRDPGLSEELLAACELVALQPMPIPFECNVNDPMGAQMLVRGLALPIPEGDDAAALVQIVLSWREILSKSAARRLRAELAQAFADITPLPATLREPFPRQPRPGLVGKRTDYTN